MNKVEVLKRSLKVKLNLTADDWQLYSIPGREAAARGINRRLEKELRDCTGDWYERCYAALEPATKFGACDTEGGYVLNRIVEEIGLWQAR